MADLKEGQKAEHLYGHPDRPTLHYLNRLPLRCARVGQPRVQVRVGPGHWQVPCFCLLLSRTQTLSFECIDGEQSEIKITIRHPSFPRSPTTSTSTVHTCIRSVP